MEQGASGTLGESPTQERMQRLFQSDDECTFGIVMITWLPALSQTESDRPSLTLMNAGHGRQHTPFNSNRICALISSAPKGLYKSIRHCFGRSLFTVRSACPISRLTCPTKPPLRNNPPLMLLSSLVSVGLTSNRPTQVPRATNFPHSPGSPSDSPPPYPSASTANAASRTSFCLCSIWVMPHARSSATTRASVPGCRSCS